MDAETVLHHLEELAKRLGIVVRYETSAGHVGMGVLRGRKIAIIEAELRVPERAAALASLLSREQTEGVYLPPEVRDRLEECAGEEAPNVDSVESASPNENARPEGAG